MKILTVICLEVMEMANCRSTGAQRRRAQAHAAALREAAEELRVEPSMELEEMPMNRYASPNAVPGTCGCGKSRCREEEIAAMLTQLVELTVCQNQLLTDLLGAVNALTAAMLSAQSRS